MKTLVQSIPGHGGDTGADTAFCPLGGIRMPLTPQDVHKSLHSGQLNEDDLFDDEAGVEGFYIF